MARYQVYYSTEREKWVAWDDLKGTVLSNGDTKKTVLNKAQGAAQSLADSQNETYVVEVWSKAGNHQRNVRVNPSY